MKAQCIAFKEILRLRFYCTMNFGSCHRLKSAFFGQRIHTSFNGDTTVMLLVDCELSLLSSYS